MFLQSTLPAVRAEIENENKEGNADITALEVRASAPAVAVAPVFSVAYLDISPLRFQSKEKYLQRDVTAIEASLTEIMEAKNKSAKT